MSKFFNEKTVAILLGTYFMLTFNTILSHNAKVVVYGVASYYSGKAAIQSIVRGVFKKKIM
jgi:hypothetical protein